MPKNKAKQKKSKKNPYPKIQVRKQPAAKGAVVTRAPPNIRPIKDGLRIKHRELLHTYVQGTNFIWSVKSFPINPGLPSTFPWLSGVARMFEQYILHGLRFHYVPIAPTTYPGSAVMCIDYDPRDAEYNLGLTRQLMMQNSSSVSTPVWGEAALNANSASLMGGMSRKFVRVYDVDPALSTSVRSSDCGDFIIGVATDDYNGANATRTYGDIWVEYDVTLTIPQPNMNPPALFQTLDTTTSPTDISHAFASTTDAYVGDKVKVDGGLFGYQGWSSTGPDQRKTWWKLIDLVPGAYYWISAAVNELTAGASDTLQFVTGDSNWSGLQLETNPVNRTSHTTGGTGLAIRGLYKALADTAGVVIDLAHASGSASTIGGSLFQVVPTPSLRDIFV